MATTSLGESRGRVSSGTAVNHRYSRGQVSVKVIVLVSLVETHLSEVVGLESLKLEP